MKNKRTRIDLDQPVRFQAGSGEVIVDGYYLGGAEDDCVIARPNIKIPHTITLAYNSKGINKFDYTGWDIDLT